LNKIYLSMKLLKYKFGRIKKWQEIF